MFIRKIFTFFVIIILLLPIITFADDAIEEGEFENSITVSNDNKETIKEPITNSKHIIAMDRKSFTVLYEKDAYSEVPMASTTKIMTAIVAIENCDLSETLEFSKEAANIRGSCLEVSSGSKISMNDALYGLMMRSRK